MNQLLQDSFKKNTSLDIVFFANADEAYKLIITLDHHIRNDGEEAFEYLERSKSRAFLDILAINADLKPSKPIERLNLLFEKEKGYLNILGQRQISSAEEISLINPFTVF